jgi:hypothetical protein
MNIPILEGKTDREKAANFTASVQKLRAELKSLDTAILEGDVAAAQRHGVLLTQLGALDRFHPALTKNADKQRREGQAEAATIRLQTQADLFGDRVTIDQYEAEMSRAARVERGGA